jgi:Bifunctional DNA primase/polymerase, N-terminal
MIATPCGERSGFWAIDPDVDQQKGIDGLKTLAELEAKNGPLPRTRTVITPRGGRHLHWQWVGRAQQIRNSTSMIGPGIDARGEGGYVALPQSINAYGIAYRWENGEDLGVAPDWLIDKALKKSKSARSSAPWAISALIDECDKVAKAKPGTRNSTLNNAAFNLGQIIAGDYLNEQEVRTRLFEAAEKCGLVADDGEQAARATIDSGLQAGLAQPRTNQTRQQQQQMAQSQAPQQQTAQPQPRPQPQPQQAPFVRPTIRLTDGELPRIVDEAEAALIPSKQHVYQHGELLVRPIRSKLKAANDRYIFCWRLNPLKKAALIELFTRAARFEKLNVRSGGYVAKNCPDLVAEVYLSRTGQWRVPTLLGVVTAPFLRPDGTLCERPGYDKASAILFHPGRQAFPPIAATLTIEDAREALKYLDKTLLEEFPFVDEKVDRAVALSLLLSVLDRRAMATAPLHGFTSPAAGTGKGLLVNLGSILATGDRAPVISMGQSEEEFEKRLGASLIASDQIITLDNIDREIKSSLLCQALTEQRLKIRVLRYSLQAEVPVTSMFCATGNNLVVSADLCRRTLLCRLDAKMERPETRSFKRDVLEIVRSERAKLVAAALTVLRAWHMARTAIGVEPFGSFEDWSYRIRQPLLWLDQADPCQSVVTVRENDPERATLVTILEAWRRRLGIASAYTIQAIINRAMVDPDLHGAIAAVAASPQGSLNNDRLGRWLRKNKDKVIDATGITGTNAGKPVTLGLRNTGMTSGYPRWCVEETLK